MSPLDPRSHQRPRAFALLALLVVAGGLSGCEAHATFGNGDAAPPAAPHAAIPPAIWDDTVRGVACYRAYETGYQALSCVKVRP